jgi:lysophospholipase L1-like esterase
MQKKPSTFKRLLYYTIFCMICLLFAEAILSMAFHYKYGNNKLAITDFAISVKSRLINPGLGKKEIENQHHNQQLVRPGTNNEMGKQIVTEMAVANAFEFDPWLQFRNRDIASKYVNVVEFIRKSIPDIVHQSTDTFCIWFFGGSTMWGFNVADEETIPSKFAQLYKEARKYHKTLQVVNYGIRSYTSFQEMKLLQDRLLYEPSPDLVIFLDGLNDVVSSSTSLYREPLYTPYMREYFRGNFPMARGKNINDFIEKHYTKNLFHTLGDTASAIFRNYSLTLNAINQTAKSYDFKSLFVWQPVPYYNYPNQKNDPACDKNQFPVYTLLNPLIKSMYKELDNTLYLADMLDGLIQFPFIDRVHYAPAMNEAIADKLLLKIDSLLIN